MSECLTNEGIVRGLSEIGIPVRSTQARPVACLFEGPKGIKCQPLIVGETTGNGEKHELLVRQSDHLSIIAEKDEEIRKLRLEKGQDGDRFPLGAVLPEV